MAANDNSANEEKGGAETDLERRTLVKRSAKALYIAPTLTLLGSAGALAQFGSPPPPPGGAPAPPTPDR